MSEIIKGFVAAFLGVAVVALLVPWFMKLVVAWFGYVKWVLGL